MRLYRRTAGHLSLVRTRYGDAALQAELSRLVGRANAALHDVREPARTVFVRFWSTTFPAATWHVRRAVLVAMLALVVPGVLTAVFLNTSTDALASAGSAEEVVAFLEGDFVDYYSDGPAPVFATNVFTNNALVGVNVFGMGLLMLPAVAVLGFNGVNVGYVVGLAHAYDRAGLVWGYLLPHGLLELTAIFVAGGAALHLAWTAIAPGDRTRAEALAAAGQRTATIVLGLVAVFLVAALLEAYVTPAEAVPQPLRVATGGVVWLGFLAYVRTRGRAAAQDGITGRLGEHRRDLGLAT